MNNTQAIMTAALASVIALGFVSQVTAAEKPEKCYGVVKAGKNDCQTANNACSGHSTQDNQADAWIYLPAGTCEKIVGGSLEPGNKG